MNAPFMLRGLAPKAVSGSGALVAVADVHGLPQGLRRFPYRAAGASARDLPGRSPAGEPPQVVGGQLAGGNQQHRKFFQRTRPAEPGDPQP
jgi:hypothetical protein